MKGMSDEAFIAAWRAARGSPKTMSDQTGIGERNIYRRRNALMRKGVVLETIANSPQGEAQSQWKSSWSFPRERAAEVRDGHVVVFSDAHFWPGPRTTANEALLEVIKALKPKRVIANGDLFDGARISRHDPHGWGDKPSVKDELDACRERMHEIALAANPRRGCDLDWNVGNHCIRFDRYLVANAAEYGGVVERLSDHFNEWAFGWSLRINGSVMVKHRWHNGVHATYNNALKGGLTIVTGHLHRLAVTPWADYTGRRYGVDTGTLAQTDGPQFEYLENNATPWCSGFAVLTFKDGLLLPPELVEVIGDSAYFRGQKVV